MREGGRWPQLLPARSLVRTNEAAGWLQLVRGRTRRKPTDTGGHANQLDTVVHLTQPPGR